MLTSHEWHRHYQQNAQSLLEIPWHLGAELTTDEIADISSSLREFQAGESSEGKHLYRNAQLYAERTDDTAYVPAIRLFIAEEQRHARELGRFLTLNGIPLVKTTFTDRVFRKMRGLTKSLEISIAVLITAEIIAKPYYAGIRAATKSVILQRICDQLLKDEDFHVKFQSERLALLRGRRRRLGMFCTLALQRFLFLGTVSIVWLLHRRALRRGGLNFATWWLENWHEFNAAFKVTKAAAVPHALPAPSIPTAELSSLQSQTS